MSSDTSNDNRDDRAFQGPDAHGRAAMLLVESLLHGLIARDLITVADAVEVVEVAADVAGEVDPGALDLRKPENLLNAVSDSLRRDLHIADG